MSMLGLDDVIEAVVGGPWGLGLAAVGAVVLVGGPRAKPLAKQAIKGYLAATQRVRELAAEATEQVQDLYVEAKYEYQAESSRDESPEAETEAEAEARPRRRSGTTPAEQPA
jgi:Sec-independent protein translocase protein TatA